METSLVIPSLPPTVNHYWGQRGTRKFLTKKGLDFRALVQSTIKLQAIPQFSEARLEVQVHLFPASKRTWDLDNRLKSLLDALEHGKVFENDGQIDRLSVVRGGRREHEFTIVSIKVLG